MKTITSKLILGLGLTLAIGAFTLTPTDTEAKSTMTVTSNQALVADGNSRNYLTTGAAPLYSKVPVYKSTKVVTKAAVLKTLGTTADAGQTYFRGYRAAQTSNGDWYLKVVSFDKTYRGWIFAGTTDPTTNPSDVSGGLKATTTFQESTVPTYFANTTMYFTTPKASTLTYVAPDYTQYKVGAQSQRNGRLLQGSTDRDQGRHQAKQSRWQCHLLLCNRRCPPPSQWLG